MPQYPTALLEQIKQLVPISRLVGEYVQADKAKSHPGDLWACCPFHAEKTPSFHAEDAKGIYHCFGCGATGDHFQWMQEHQGMTFTQAVEAVADMAGVSLPGTRSEPSVAKPRARYEAPTATDPYATYTLTPAPTDTPLIEVGKRTPKLRNPKHVGTSKFETTYVPDEASPYHDADGNLLGYVLRMDTKTGKITPGIWWMKCEDGWEGWSHGSLPSPRPLNNLLGLLAQPDIQVLVVGGERKRRMAAEALEGRRIVVISWIGGDNAVSKTDWSPLNGRRIVWWPDNDPSGHAGMLEARKLASGSENKRIAPYGDKGGDVADLIAAGSSVAEYIKANISEWKGTEDAKHDNAEAEHSSGRGGTDSAAADRSSAKSHDRLDKNAVGPKDAKPTRQSAIHEGDSKAQRGALDEPHTNDAINGERDPQPSPAPENNSPGTQSLGGVSREAVKDAQEVDPVYAIAASNPAEPPDEGPDPVLAIDPNEWENKLIRTEKGTWAKKSPQNTALFIQFHDDFKGIFAFNEFSRDIMLMRRPPWQPGSRKWTPRVMDEDDETALQGQLEYCDITIGINDLSRAISRVAKHNKYNPVLERLQAMKWDGVKRLSGEGQRQGWLTRYFGAAPTEINKVFGRKWWVSMCSRIVIPGSQVDTVLIIEGGQGAMKSTSFRLICSPFGDDYFLDNLADPYSKDGKMAVQGKLIVELAELEAFRRSEESQKKSWITTRVDEFRPPFGRMVRKYPRTFGIVGTENPTGTGYLKDSTGARRYWPVMSNEIDYDMLKEDVEQLWAEAYEAYKAGEIWWLTKDEEALAAVEQRKRFKHDPWLPSITKALKGESSTNPVKLMEVLDIPKKERTVAGNDRIVAVLTMMQWEGRMVDGETHYFRPLLN